MALHKTEEYEISETLEVEFEVEGSDQEELNSFFADLINFLEDQRSERE